MVDYEKRPSQLSKLSIWIVISIILVFGVFAWVFTANNRTSPANGGPAEQPSVEAVYQENRQVTAANSSSSAAQPAKTSGSAAVPEKVTIKMVTPVFGETWTIRKSHEIRWSRPATRSGGIILLDAATKNVVGWITPSLSSSQVVYNWNTSDVLVGRTNPAKKDIVPGAYILRVVFDGLQPLDSAPLSIVAGSEKIVTEKVSVKGSFFSPSFITVPRGRLVIILNEDTANRTVLMNGVTLAVLPQWNSYVFDTSKYSAGVYEIRIKEEVTAKLEITIK